MDDLRLRDCAHVNRQFGLHYDEARTHHEWGRMLEARNHAGDRQAADEHFASALDIFRPVGTEHAVAKLLDLRRRLPLRSN